MAICLDPVSVDRPQSHSSPAHNAPALDVFARMHDALQSLANCTYLLARDRGISPENVPLLAHVQADVAMLTVLLRQLERPRTLSGNTNSHPITEGKL